MRPWIFVALVAALPVSALAASAPSMGLDPSQSELDFTVSIRGRDVPGTTHALEGAVRPSGRGDQVEVRANTMDFRTRDATRDVDMKSAIDAARYPTVIFKGLLRDVREPTQFPATFVREVDGQIQFHGQTHPIRAPVEITFTAPGEARVTTEFDISLKEYKIKPPSILLAHVRDRCHIHAELQFVRLR